MTVILNRGFQLGMLLLAFASSAPVSADRIDSVRVGYSESFMPYSGARGSKVEGILVDVANEILQNRQGITTTHKSFPWQRAQQNLVDGRVDALITNGTLRSDWVSHSSEVILHLHLRLYLSNKAALRMPDTEIDTAADLKDFQFIVHRGNAWAKKHLLQSQLTVTTVPSQEQIFQMIASGRADANVNDTYVARYFIDRLKQPEKIVETGLIFSRLPFHFVFAKDSEYAELLPRIDEIIREMHRDGSLRRIVSKYVQF